MLRIGLIIAGFLLPITILASCAKNNTETPEELENTPEEVSEQSTENQPQDDYFQKALDEGMKAAEAAQTAQISSEWESVRNSWDSAIDNLNLISQNSPDYEKAQAKLKEYSKNRDYAQQRALEAEPSTLFSRSQICKATISSMMGRDLSIVKVDSQSEGITYLSYIRPDDNTEWKFRCKIEGSSIIWAAEPDGRWRTDPADSELTFSIDSENKNLTIRETFSDGSSSEDVFNASQL